MMRIVALAVPREAKEAIVKVAPRLRSVHFGDTLDRGMTIDFNRNDAMITINPETVCYIIAKAREIDVKVAPEELSDDSDDMERILEDYADDATYQELREFLRIRSDDELIELLALTWIGRGEYSADEWQEVMKQIRDVREQHTVDYLLGTPLLADYLEDGLDQFGINCNG